HIADLIVVEEGRDLRAEPTVLITPNRAGQDQRQLRRSSRGNDFRGAMERFESPAPQQVVLLTGLKGPASQIDWIRPDPGKSHLRWDGCYLGLIGCHQMDAVG